MSLHQTFDHTRTYSQRSWLTSPVDYSTTSNRNAMTMAMAMTPQLIHLGLIFNL